MTLVQDSTHPTGVSADRGGSSVTRARERKANAALAMRKDHHSWADIAEVLGYPTPKAALVAVEQALEAGLATDESQDFMRRMASETLQTLLYGVMKKARDPDHPEHLLAVTKAREVVMDHAKLMGYVAPAEVAIYTPMAKEIEEFIGEVLKERQPDTLEESDIFGDDAEPVELREQDDGTYAVEEV